MSMDPPQSAFEELERAFGSTLSVIDHLDQTKVDSTPFAPAKETVVSSVYSNPPRSDDEDEVDGDNIIGYPFTGSSRNTDTAGAGLPPTPPNLVYDHDPERDSLQTPKPTSASSARLHSQASSLSSPVVDWHSHPTPNPSPPSTHEAYLSPFYELSHNPSSCADSFKTAREVQSVAGSLNSHRWQSPFEKAAITSRPVSIEMANPNFPQGIPQQLQTHVNGSDGVEPEVFSPQSLEAESGSAILQHTAPDKRPVSDPEPQSPTLGRSLSQGTAQRRLRSVIQPGDTLKRPDESLLYFNHSSSVRRALPKPSTQEVKAEKPIQDVENTSAAEVTKPLADLMPVPDANIDEDKTEDQHQDVPAELPRTPDQVKDDALEDAGNVIKEDAGNVVKEDADNVVKEDAGSVIKETPRTPPSAAKSSLEDNNVVYKLIREENVKRHSNISDGSVQCVVVALPEHKRTLRHTPKRQSLRGDSSLTSKSNRSSAESGQKSTKRHTGTTLSASDTDLTSPDVSPTQAKAALKEAVTSKTAPPVQQITASSTQDKRTPQRATSREEKSNPEPGSAKRSIPSEHTLRRSIRKHSLDHPKIPNPEDSTEIPRSASPPLHQAAHMSSKPVYVPLVDLNRSPKLRRFSNDSRLENNSSVRRTSLDKTPHRVSQPLEVKLEQAAKDLTREGQELHDDRLSMGWTSVVTSPKRASFDTHLHPPTQGSFSMSQASFRSDVEVLEARGVTIFPHNNESLVVIQQGSRLNGKVDSSERPSTSAADEELHASRPKLAVSVRPRAASVDAIGKPKHAVDSPLTNPRAPPEPPLIKFIPPTPSNELELDLSPENDAEHAAVTLPQRRPSLSQRVRLYSEQLIQPLGLSRFGSLRKQQLQHRERASTISGERPTHLSSFWQPRDFWEEYDSESDEVFDEDDPVTANIATLPPGGDTSDIGQRSTSFFPRNMSVRMPGFRGTGGFLQGNSLGIDRHGSNNRRHYVRRLTSEEMLRRVAERRRRRTFVLPFSRGTKVEFIGLAFLQSQLHAIRTRREELALEQRREQLRSRIGTRVYHDPRYGSS